MSQIEIEEVASLLIPTMALLSGQIFQQICGEEDGVLLLVYVVTITKDRVTREMYYCYNVKGKRKGMIS